MLYNLIITIIVIAINSFIYKLHKQQRSLFRWVILGILAVAILVLLYPLKYYLPKDNKAVLATTTLALVLSVVFLFLERLVALLVKYRVVAPEKTGHSKAGFFSVFLFIIFLGTTISQLAIIWGGLQ